MSDPDAILDEFLRRMRSIGSLPEDTARFAAPFVEAEAKRTASAGTTPDGKPWAPKKDGGRALEHAADHLSAKAVGPTVVLTLTGPDVIHNRGTERMPKRQILPSGGAELPKGIIKAMVDGAKRAFGDHFGGGR